MGMEDGWMLNPWLSASQIAMFLRCPRQWAFRYIEGRRVPPSGAMKQSGVFHTTAEENYRQKIDSGMDLPEGDLTEMYADTFEREWQREEVVLDPGQTKGGLKDQGVDIVREYRAAVAPHVQPVQVEEKFDIALGKDDYGFRLTGRIDVVDQNNLIRDNKAMGKTPTQLDVDKDTQLSTYALARRLQTQQQARVFDPLAKGTVEAGLRLDVVVKTQRPKAVVLQTQRTREALAMHLNRIGNIAKAIRADAFPTNPNGWHCQPRFCGYWNLCMGRGIKTVDQGEHLQEQLEESIRQLHPDAQVTIADVEAGRAE